VVLRFPIDPHIIGHGNAGHFPAGGAGLKMHRAHRLHPDPGIVISIRA
jgi:hypothetical protein